MNYTSLKVKTPPAYEPVTLAQAKAHCRIEVDTDDAYVSSLVVAAREYCSDYLDMSIVPTQYVLRLDTFPASIELPRPPMASAGTATAVSITYTINDTGATATLATQEYRVDRDSMPGVIRPLYGQTWPSHLADHNSISVTWWGGEASPDQRVKNAMLMLVLHWYERRHAADSSPAAEVPFGVKALLDSVKWGSYR